MIPKVNNRGHSFKGVTAYLMHDKKADTGERVEWTHTGNMHTNDIEKAALVMAWTDKNAEMLKAAAGVSLSGAKPSAGGVYHYSLSWSPDEQPDKEHMQAQALETLQRLGLAEHQYYIVAHSDTDHTHLHVVANLTNHETGQRVTPSFDKKELQAWALEYEREHGLYCHLRVENALKREQGEHVKYRDTKQDYSEQVTRAYYAADSGKAFANSLEMEGLHLAQGRRGGFVIVDETGDIQKLGRQLEIEQRGKEKTAVIKALLGDIQAKGLQDAEELAAQIKETQRESQGIDQKEKTTSEAFNKQAGEVGGHTATDSTARGNGGLTAAAQKETAQSFNQEAEESHQQAPEEARNAPNPYSGQTTQEIAAAFVELAGEPMQDLRGWLDATEQGQSNNSLSTGQAGSSPTDNELRQVRGQDEAEGINSPTPSPEAPEQPEHFDRDKFNIDLHKRMEAAAIAYGEELRLKEEITPKLEKLHIPRYARLKQIKGENAELWKEQSTEKAELVARLKKEQTEKERTERAKWKKVINQEQDKQDDVLQKIKQKGFVGFLVRLRHGEDMRQQYKAHEMNIKNAQMRLAENLENLTRYEKARLATLTQNHKEQRDSLRKTQKEDLQSIEDTRAEKEEKLLQAAQVSPELAAEIKSAVNAKTSRGKAAAAKIEGIERSYKQDKPAHTPADGKREHEAQPDKMQPPTLSQEQQRASFENVPPVKPEFEESAGQAPEMPLSEKFTLRQQIAAQAAALRGDYGEDMKAAANKPQMSDEEYRRMLEQFAQDHPEELERGQDIEQDNGLER